MFMLPDLALSSFRRWNNQFDIMLTIYHLFILFFRFESLKMDVVADGVLSLSTDDESARIRLLDLLQ